MKNSSTFYPPVPACLYARFPEPYVFPLGVFINYFADALSAICIYIFLFHNGLDPFFSLLSSLLWVSLPILHPVNARLVGLGSRTLGPLFHLIWIFGAYFSITSHWLLGLGIMVPFGALIFLSSQMASQSMILQTLVISLCFLDPIPLLSFICSITITLYVSSSDMFVSKYLHIRWYYLHGRKFISTRNSFLQFRRILFKNPFQSIIYVVTSTTPGISIICFIGLLPLFWNVLSPDFSISITSTVKFCLVVVSAGSLGALLTVTGPLVIFGESERYLEYMSPFLLIGLVLSQSNSLSVDILYLGIIMGLFGVFLNHTLSKLGNFISLMHQHLSIVNVDEIRRSLAHHGPRRIATSPISLASRLSVSLDQPDYYLFLHNLVCDKTSRSVPWPESPGLYPYLDTRPQFLDKFDIDTVIIDRSFLHRLPEATGLSHLSQWTRITTGSYVIFIRTLLN